MMDVKKYRAATTLEALELVKGELGEEAFVLGTKAVKTGGFLGFGTKREIEISAALSLSTDKPARNEGFRSTGILNLTDDLPATPLSAAKLNKYKKESLMSALSSQAVSTVDNSGLERPKFENVDPGQIELVEISSEAPRIVHPRREPVKRPEPQAAPVVAAVPSETQSAPVINRDFELLRAEMREVKFSLGAFANRQNANHWNDEIDLDLFTDTVDGSFRDLYTELTATGLSGTIARKYVGEIIPNYRGQHVNTSRLTRATLQRAISSLIDFVPDPFEANGPVVMAMIGSTGVGKTTTIAKLAARVALYQHRRVEMITLDTYRIAAVEQLKTYAEIIGAGCQVVRSVFELDAVLRRLPADATVLIDTTGRNPHDLADQFEVSDYLQQRPEIRKCLAIQATTHPIDVLAAIKKFEMYGADCLALTKIDETVRPGAVIETVAESGLPLAYICAGQRVPEDLHVATAETLTHKILGSRIATPFMRAAA